MEPVVGVALIVILGALSVLNRAQKRRISTGPPRRNRQPRGGQQTRGIGQARGTRHQAGSQTRQGNGTHRAYPGDFTGVVRPKYSAALNGSADPGEIVWTWVPYEDDPSQGKDRPVLVIGRDGNWLLSLMLTSKDHDRDAADEARWGRRWLDIGSGTWDRQERPSEVRLDRIIRVHPDDVRREGAIMARPLFDRISRSL